MAVTITLNEWRIKFTRDTNARDNEKSSKRLDSILNFETVKYHCAETHEENKYEEAIEEKQKAEWRSIASVGVLHIAQDFSIACGMLPGSILIQQSFVDMENMFEILHEEKEVGPSGMGKTTIFRLLFRLFDVQFGSILIDGQNIAKVTQKSVRQAIGVVPQDTVLFNEDIRSNIRYGRISASDEDVEKAAACAQIHNRIVNFPCGYKTIVGERGLKLSGGEKQRVAIARSFLKLPAIILLDEATSALDSLTEKQLKASIDEICKTRTTLIVAHRLSTVVSADEIMVIDDGKIVESGSMNENVANNFFSKYSLYILPTGIGKSRVNLFKAQFLRHGGCIQQEFSSGKVTHILVDESVDWQKFCKIMKWDQELLEKFKDIIIVNTLWLSRCLKAKELVDINEFILKKSENTDTINKDDLGEKNKRKLDEIDRESPKKLKNVKRARLSSSDYESGDENNSRDNTSASEKSRLIKEPERCFYFSTFASQYVLVDSKSKWVCAHSSKSEKQENLNQHITDKLAVLANAYKNTKDEWRALGYRKAISALSRHPNKITTWEEAKAIRGVGERLADKIYEIIQSGHLRKIDEVCSGERMEAINLFTELWGAGPTTAELWVQQGFRSLDDLREKAKLTNQQKIGLKYYNEILERMPREEAAKIEAEVRKVAIAVQPGVEAIACGSYRRGKATCGDVDVLITHPDGKSHAGLFHKVLNALHESGFLTDDLLIQEDNCKQQKYLGVCMLKGPNQKHRRLDIIVVPYAEFACAIMYFTGSAHFNRSMRHLAKNLNMSLTEHSLNAGVVRDFLRALKTNERICFVSLCGYAELKKSQTTKKRLLSRTFNILKQLKAEGAVEFGDYLNKLKVQFKDFQDAHEACLAELLEHPKVSEEEIDECDEYFLKKQSEYIETLNLFKQQETQAGVPLSFESTINSLTCALSKTNIPVSEPDIFYGEPTSYPTWRKSFKVMIESKVEPSHRLFYLLKYTSRQAKDCIQCLMALDSDEAYDKACKTLDSRFGDPFLIAQAYRAKIEQWSKVTDGIGLQRYADF
ncbi:DNA polymerase lambda [Nymphon striatum]|nr:DNA polymerase lambda [Nymphon striatum]